MNSGDSTLKSTKQTLLYEPTIELYHEKRTISYKISYFYFVALIGGMIALMGVGLQNARMIKLPKRRFVLLIMISGVFFLGKIGITLLFYFKLLGMHKLDAFLRFRGLDLVMFLAYYQLFKPYYRIHLAFDGPIYYLRKNGTYWCMAGLLLDFMIFFVK